MGARGGVQKVLPFRTAALGMGWARSDGKTQFHWEREQGPACGWLWDRALSSWMVEQEIWELEGACDQWRASLGQWHRDPAGARIGNLNSDTSFCPVFGFHLNILWVPEIVWLKNTWKLKNGAQGISLQIWKDSLPGQVAADCLRERGTAAGVGPSHPPGDGHRTPTTAVSASWCKSGAAESPSEHLQEATGVSVPILHLCFLSSLLCYPQYLSLLRLLLTPSSESRLCPVIALRSSDCPCTCLRWRFKICDWKLESKPQTAGIHNNSHF